MRVADKTGKSQRIKRNARCLCGSGRKFKHCCLPGVYRQAQIEREVMGNRNEEGKPKLSNEFRDNLEKQEQAERDPVEVEAEKVGDAEMMKRDMHTTMRSLQVTKMVAAMDRAHTEAAIRVYDEFIDELAELPISEATRDIAINIVKQVVSLKKAAEGSQLTRASLVMLEALEEVMDVRSEVVVGDDLNEADDKTLEDIVGDRPEESLGETAESLKEDDSLDDEPTGDEEI